MLTIEAYAPCHASLWDDFVMEKSVNGTFLQTRRFLSYHPENRFRDASLMVLNGQQLCAVVPAADQTVDGVRMARSHPGSTFGGPIIDRGLLRAPKLVELMDALDAYRIGEGYGAAEYKLTGDVFCSSPSDALEYALYHAGYRDELEISCILPLQGKSYETLLSDYSFAKRYDLKKIKDKFTFREFNSEDDITTFYALLCLNLQKFGASPVHTLKELLSLKCKHLTREMRFLGVFDENGGMVAGACLFVFAQTNTLHTQYLATSPAVKGASVFLYDSVIRFALQEGFATLSFGTSTHDRGRVLNTGLIQNKEGYGSCHCVNRIYTKYFTDSEGKKP